ncbi:hypothetical protein [Rhizobium rhizogenes]|uniref:hypothetical protein n=1 Tax=Rhizobium rhizogenes TaxID=359 RepID=UPI0022BBDEB7|nr:hypothetical protein [Rhizobium rhizogenes]MCZ7488539.1 hypothetical protein [Rhizobium rhizogenes]
MSILSVVQNVCLAVGLTRPDVVMSSQDREMTEMVRLARDVSIRIRDAEFDWQTLTKVFSFNGDGTAEAFALPSDYSRMPTSGRVWSSRWSWEIQKVGNIDDWLQLISVPIQPVTGQWIIFSDQMHILPVMDATETIRYPYISNLIVKSSAGDEQTGFVADTDTFRLSEYALELGMIWAYRSQKGVASDDDEQNYNKALYTAMNNDKGSKPVISGNTRRFDDAKFAFPFKVNP